MEIRQLKYFVSIAEAGNFSNASRKLYVSQSALSKSMRKLEEELGCELFYMSGNKVMLTDFGEILYPKVKELLDKHDSIINSMNDLFDEPVGTIKMGVAPILGTCVFPEIAAGFLRQYPQVDFSITQRGAKHIQELVENETLDVGFTIEPLISGMFDSTPITNDKNVVIVSKKHRLAGRKSVSYQDLREENFVLLDKEFMLINSVYAGCNEAGFEPKVIMSGSNWDFIACLVHQNLGISVLPRIIFDIYPDPDICQIELDHISNRWNVIMITKKDCYLSIASRKFVEYVKKQKQQL